MRRAVIFTALFATGCAPAPENARVDAGNAPVDAGALDAGALGALDAGALDAGAPVDAGALGVGLLGTGDADPTPLWTIVAAKLKIDTAALTACTAPSECTAIHHFTRCCTYLPIATKYADVVNRKRRTFGFVQTKQEHDFCSIADCSGVPPPVTCTQGKCVVSSR